MATPKLSLIICTRNRAAPLRQCLQALDTQELAEVSGEVVLVDNGSTDDTKSVLQRFRDEAPCTVKIAYEPRKGAARGRNTGLAHAEGEVIVLVDDDCYLAPEYFKKASVVFDSGDFHYCGGRILLYDPSDAELGCNLQETFELIPPYSFLPTGKIQGTNMVVHRRVFDKIGGFDPNIGAGTPFVFEEIDFCARASMAGFAGAHVPELVVYHRHGRKPGNGAVDRRKVYDVGRGAYYAKLALLGDYQFLSYWAMTAWERQRAHLNNPRVSLGMLSWTVREVRGALSYLWTRTRSTLNEREKFHDALIEHGLVNRPEGEHDEQPKPASSAFEARTSRMLAPEAPPSAAMRRKGTASRPDGVADGSAPPAL